MRYPQVLVYERDGQLASRLKDGLTERGRKWVLREPRDPAACLRLLERGGPAVMVVKLSGDLERELTLLERTAALHPDAKTVLVGDAEHVGLAGAAWDLGASYVLLPPMSRESLADIVVGLMGKE
jgi:DNA-binding NarL/FixJ family response regulator